MAHQATLRQFDIPGELESLSELKRGHINKTYVAVWRIAGKQRQYVHQVINHSVFHDVDGLMTNIKRVTEHLASEIAAGNAREGDTTLTIVPAKNGALWVQDDAGCYWRTLEFVGDSSTYEVCSEPAMAREAAAILGRFHRAMLTLPGEPLEFTIPHFHDGRHRFVALEEALDLDTHNRREESRAEIEFAVSRRELGGLLPSAIERGEIPSRVAHSDMKLNNVLFRGPTNRAVCLVDLDTCMPGSPLFDFGDLVRNTAVPCREDEQDLSKVLFEPSLFDAIGSGWFDEFGAHLGSAEKALIPLAPRSLAYILGVRFLTDHLNGDTYFRIHHPGHNLERARTQFAVVRVMEKAESGMRL